MLTEKCLLLENKSVILKVIKLNKRNGEHKMPLVDILFLLFAAVVTIGILALVAGIAYEEKVRAENLRRARLGLKKDEIEPLSWK